MVSWLVQMNNAQIACVHFFSLIATEEEKAREK
jgi:hypothetical protein